MTVGLKFFTCTVNNIFPAVSKLAFWQVIICGHFLLYHTAKMPLRLSVGTHHCQSESKSVEKQRTPKPRPGLVTMLRVQYLGSCSEFPQSELLDWNLGMMQSISLSFPHIKVQIFFCGKYFIALFSFAIVNTYDRW